jgi:hypothetical protein
LVAEFNGGIEQGRRESERVVHADDLAVPHNAAFLPWSKARLQ